MSAKVFWMRDPERQETESPFVRQPHYNDLENRIAQLEAALGKLTNEVGGSLRGFEPEVREAIGNTNWECVMLRVREAAALLLPTLETEGK